MRAAKIQKKRICEVARNLGKNNTWKRTKDKILCRVIPNSTEYANMTPRQAAHEEYENVNHETVFINVKE